jgi:hypothetical protein
MLHFKICEVLATNICNGSQFNVFLFRELHGVVMRIEFSSTGFYVSFGSVFSDIASARTAKLLRARKDHVRGVLFALWGHCGLYITNQSALCQLFKDFFIDLCAIALH